MAHVIRVRSFDVDGIEVLTVPETLPSGKYSCRYAGGNQNSGEFVYILEKQKPKPEVVKRFYSEKISRHKRLWHETVTKR